MPADPARLDAVVEIEVVDAQGEGLPFALLEVRADLPWCDLGADGVQRTDRYTDARGRRQIEHLSPGRTGIGARFGERKGWERIEVEEGGRARVRLVLK